MLHNGVWQLYDTVFRAAGIPFEQFVMSNLVLTNANGLIYLAHPFIDVYVEDMATHTMTRWDRVMDIFDSKPTDRHFEVRLDESKQYVLRFGDGINGARIPQGCNVYALWLKSDGANGKIGTLSVDTRNAAKVGAFDRTLGVVVNGLSQQFVTANFLQANATYESPALYDMWNTDASTDVADFESVGDIRQFAPSFFRMQNRLVTSQDYEQYVLASHIGNHEILDVRAHGNTDYMRDFQQWLYSYGKLSPELTYYGYRYADSCDFNNVYLWLKSSSPTGATVSFNTKDIVQRDVDKLKSLTSETVILNPILVAFTPFNPLATPPTWDEISTTGYFNSSKIVLVRDRNTLVSVESIRRKAYGTITSFFGVSNNRLGGTVDLGMLLGRLLTISGVKEVKTVKFSTDGVTPTNVFSGLSFGVWTPLILRGADFVTSNGSFGLRSFQFPFLFEENKILGRIVVESENFKLNNVEY